MLWNLKYPVGLNQREICAHFNQGNFAQFGRSADKICVELQSVFAFSRPKIAQQKNQNKSFIKNMISTNNEKIARAVEQIKEQLSTFNCGR